MKQFIAIALAATSALTVMPAAAQSLDGKTISLNITGSELGDFGTQSAVAGSGINGSFFSGNIQFNAGLDTFNLISSDNFGGFENVDNVGSITYTITGLDFGSAIKGITFNTPLTGVTYSFTANSATFITPEQPIPAGTYLTANFTAGAVPEPATWAMMMVGFGLIGFGLRRRMSNVTTTVRFA